MFRAMCKSKIQRLSITRTELKYEGSIGLDKNLLEASDIYPNEIVQVLNLNNGKRFETYAIEEKKGSGNAVLYGPAARLGQAGDEVIVISKVLLKDKEAAGVKIKVVHVDKKNRLIKE